MSRYNARLLVAASVVVLSTAVACGGAITTDEQDSEGSGSEEGFQLSEDIKERGESEETLTIRISYHDPSLPFAQPIKEGVEAAAEELDVDAQLVGPTGGSADQQVNEIETMLSQGVDGLAISASSNDALTPVIDQAIDQGVPVISFNTNNPDSKQLAFVGQDLKESGAIEAEELLKLLNGKEGKVVLFSVDTGAGWSNDRVSGFQEVIEEKGEGVEIVGPINTGNEPQKAFDAVENAMEANSDAIAIASVDCCSFTAAQEWVEQNSAEDIVLVGHDVLPPTVQALKSGVADLTLSQDPYTQGYEAVRVLVDYIRGESDIKDVNTGILTVTEDNVDEVEVEG